MEKAKYQSPSYLGDGLSKFRKGEKVTNIPTFHAPPEYYELWKSSVEDPESFWGEIAEKSINDIYWFKKWDRVFERRFPQFKWFVSGKTNIAYNCVDYKLSRYKDKAAYIQEAPELGISRTITYGGLFDTVKRYTAALRNLGVKKGDRVLFYIPNSIEAVTMLQACARMGAISTCVFAGFSPRALADRIELTKPKAIFTQDFTLRRGRKVELKKSVDEALNLCSQEVADGVKSIIVNPIERSEISLTSNKDISLAEFEGRGEESDKGYVELEANEPLLKLLPLALYSALSDAPAYGCTKLTFVGFRELLFCVRTNTVKGAYSNSKSQTSSLLRVNFV